MPSSFRNGICLPHAFPGRGGTTICSRTQERGLQDRTPTRMGHGGWYQVSSSYNTVRCHYNAVNLYLRPGIVVACICECVLVCVCVNPKIVHTITHHPFKLESPNLDKIFKTPWLTFVLWVDWPWLSRSNLTWKSEFHIKTGLSTRVNTQSWESFICLDRFTVPTVSWSPPSPCTYLPRWLHGPDCFMVLTLCISCFYYLVPNIDLGCRGYFGV